MNATHSTHLEKKKEKDIIFTCVFISSISIHAKKPRAVQRSFLSAAPSCPSLLSTFLLSSHLCKLNVPAPSSARWYQQPACRSPVRTGCLAKAILQPQSILRKSTFFLYTYIFTTSFSDAENKNELFPLLGGVVVGFVDGQIPSLARAAFLEGGSLSLSC